jgi:hypothetical protein
MLLPGLGIRTDMAGTSNVLTKGAIGCDPPVVLSLIGASPVARSTAEESQVPKGLSYGVRNGSDPRL